MSDAEAVREARTGNPEAFRALVERPSRSLFGLMYRMTGSSEDAEDLVQETFLRTYRQLARFDERSGFRTWLHRIGTNCALDFLRARKSRRESRPEEGMDAPCPAPSPERLARSREIAALLAPAVSRLSEMERAAFILRHYEGVGIEEISRTLDVLPNAAKHAVFRAVKKLREALEPVTVAER